MKMQNTAQPAEARTRPSHPPRVYVSLVLRQVKFVVLEVAACGLAVLGVHAAEHQSLQPAPATSDWRSAGTRHK